MRLTALTTLLALHTISTMASPVPALFAMSNTTMANLATSNDDTTLEPRHRLPLWAPSPDPRLGTQFDFNDCFCKCAAEGEQEIPISNCVQQKFYITMQSDSKWNKWCGRGVLDNVRGRCQIVDSWKCDRLYNNRTGFYDARMFFKVGPVCSRWDVSQAIMAAAGGFDLPCTGKCW